MLLQVSTGRDPPIPPAFNETCQVLPIKLQSSSKWAHYFGYFNSLMPRGDWEQLFDIALLMVNNDANTRLSAETCIRRFDEHHMKQIRPWIYCDGRRKTSVSVCLSALLEYGLVSYQNRQKVLREASQRKASFEISFASRNKQDPGVYVDAGTALEVVHECLPRLTHSLENLLREVRERHET